MAIHVACEACGSRLKAPDQLAGRKLKCPKCGGAVAVPAAPPPPGPEPAPPPKRKAPADALTERKPPPTEEPPEPAPRPKRKAPADALTERKPPPAAGPPEPEEHDEGEDRPRRKKKRRKKRPASTMPSWAWGVIAGGIAVGVLATAGILVAVIGLRPELVALGIVFGIMLVISTVILIISMIISSAIVGGMEFGQLHVVIPKAIGLLIVVNAVAMIPCFGWLLMIPIWIVGCMLVFGLELWEARVLVGVNIVLNVLMWYLVVPAILVGLTHALPEGGAPGPAPPLPKQQASSVQAIEALGGAVDRDDNSPGAPVVEVSLAHSRATDADLARLKDFPKLQVLGLDGTAVTDDGLAQLEGLKSLEELSLAQTHVTDAGLVHLRGLTKLETLDLTETRVTDAGIQNLKRALPQLKVNVTR